MEGGKLNQAFLLLQSPAWNLVQNRSLLIERVCPAQACGLVQRYRKGRMDHHPEPSIGMTPETKCSPREPGVCRLRGWVISGTKPKRHGFS